MIKKLSCYLPHVHILEYHHGGKEGHKEFKLRGYLHDVLCRRDYEERVVSIFLIKLNHNIMAEICLYLLKSLT